MEQDRPLHLRRRAITLLGCAIFGVAAWAVARSPGVVEDIYARRVGFWIARALSVASAVVPVSLAEIALAGVVLYLLVPFVTATVRVLRRRRSVLNAIAAGALRLLTASAVVLCVFYLCWGLNYARASLPARVGWTPIEETADAAERQRQIDEIDTVAGQLVDATNDAYREVAGSDDLGRPSERSSGLAGLDVVFDAAYVRLQQRLALEPAFAAARGRAKPAAASALMNHLRLGGFYFPWTGEANYNRLLPAPTLPHAVAHEKAHQRGLAPEDEANFVGYLACVMSDDAYTRYSGYLFAQGQLLGELARRDRARAKALIGRRAPGVERDVAFIQAFWARYEGPAARVSLSVNDRFLKSQGMKGGVASYAASRSLIVLFARHNGGAATVARPVR
jgi:hypothetical protein